MAEVAWAVVEEEQVEAEVVEEEEPSAYLVLTVKEYIPSFQTPSLPLYL
uniref:Uncharacterized protein n=1 Tax=viral metagenome TaxID=1070528 RepID=A0A6M3LUT0_9ZZZZ